MVRTDSTHPSYADSNDTAIKLIALQRSRINRQLHLLFVYPMAYICMWIIPFTIHCMKYNNYWAQHPPYVLSCLFILCVATMGAVDCLIFSLLRSDFLGLLLLLAQPVHPSNIEQGEDDSATATSALIPTKGIAESESSQRIY